jgi:membrane protease YdiL (CAAX protease family)
VVLVRAGSRAPAGGSTSSPRCSTSGSAPPSLAQFSPFSTLIVVFAVRLINPLDGPMGEEPGWRGFALPTLQAQRLPLLATLILAVLVTLGHLPLWVVPQFGAGPCDILGTLRVTCWYTWLFNNTGGSVLMTILAHATEGTIQTEAFWEAGSAAARMSLLYGVVWLAVAIGLVIFDRRLWRGPAPAPATMQPASYGGESRVR